MTLRSRLIANGTIFPLANRPTLRLDDRGRAAASEHMADYQKDPERYSSSRFWFDLDECMFPTPPADKEWI